MKAQAADAGKPARELPGPRTDEITIVGVLQALADPQRLEIVLRIAALEGENCTVIGDGLNLHKSTLSHHYRVLREAGVTQTWAQGRSRFTTLRRDDLDARFPGLLGSVLAALPHDGTQTTPPARP
ncbi:ArsR/SmtB family transcription factor [Streptomyces sp. NPDC090442]|uniref:ArsR/SmtB family transcription factor n=1 Tax=Streptomyces sp. NPDC090442 TaxID=3365962 RepID=UPI003814556A